MRRGYSKCDDCGFILFPTEYIMLKWSVWSAATHSDDTRFLCIGCTETRLGRRLTSEDFPKGSLWRAFNILNPGHMLDISDRLFDRLNGAKEWALNTPECPSPEDCDYGEGAFPPGYIFEMDRYRLRLERLRNHGYTSRIVIPSVVL